MTPKGTGPIFHAFTSFSQGGWSAGWNIDSPDLLTSQALILQPGQIND